MSHGNQSYLRFSLEESVWFQRGQEVEELISISLDPNITINESDQYVTIKGVLELYGEYNRNENDLEEESDGFSNPKFVQNVEVREEGGCFFTHHFPVEITIPKSRIDDIENIDVAVETFDYAFPERSCLRLSADLMITGLYGEQQHAFFQEQEDDFIDDEADDEFFDRTDELEDTLESELEEEESQEYTEIPVAEYSVDRQSVFSRPDELPDDAEEESEEREEIDEPFETEAQKEIKEENGEIYEPFEAEARKEANADEALQKLTKGFKEDEIQQESHYPQPEQAESASETYDFTALEREEVREEEKEPSSAFEEEKEAGKTSTVPDIIFSAKRNEKEAIINRDEQEESRDLPSVLETTAAEGHQEAENEEPAAEQEESAEEETPAKDKKGKWKKKQSLSIAEFLARKEETSESHAQLRVCIVQKGETIDALSDRYDVSVTHLQRVNNLEINQDVFEGQVLYIPVVQNQK